MGDRKKKKNGHCSTVVPHTYAKMKIAGRKYPPKRRRWGWSMLKRLKSVVKSRKKLKSVVKSRKKLKSVFKSLRKLQVVFKSFKKLQVVVESTRRIQVMRSIRLFRDCR